MLAIVVPCYNDRDVIAPAATRLTGLLDTMIAAGLVASESYLLCVDDGSHDGTWNLITSLHERCPRVKGVALAHNRGQQYALLAGLMTVADRCDAAVTIDADLQDDPEAIPEMVKLFHEGKEIVYGVRASRAADSWFKRTTARGFYSLQRRMGMETVYDHADYRLMSRRAVAMLADYGETNLFLRGIIPQLGLDTAVVTYDRAERIAGNSKYTFAKMVSFSVDGITSFSARPIRMIFMLGLVLLLIDVIVGIYVFVSYFDGRAILGWPSLMLSVWFLGSVILMAIGVVGEYIGKIFSEVKRRPRYSIRDTLW